MNKNFVNPPPRPTTLSKLVIDGLKGWWSKGEQPTKGESYSHVGTAIRTPPGLHH
jgi:hypothetical protein